MYLFISFCLRKEFIPVRSLLHWQLYTSISEVREKLTLSFIQGLF
jgi:hypothetical protein